MARPPEVLEFEASSTAGVVAVMDEMAGEGKGWINYQPAVDPDDVPPAGGLFRVFSVRGPVVPLCTWLPADPGQRVPYASLGVQHGAASRVAAKLAEAGAGVPDGWRVMQDQPKKGLVVAVPADTPRQELLDWLLRAGHAVCPLPYRGWRAVIHRR